MKCKTGKRLIKKWADAMHNANMNNWQAIFYGKREFDTHRKRCKKCKMK